MDATTHIAPDPSPYAGWSPQAPFQPAPRRCLPRPLVFVLGAVCGLIVGVVATVIVGMALTLTDEVVTGGTLTYGRGGDLAAFSLRPGECATATLDGDPEIGGAVDCSQLHDVEMALAEEPP